MRRILALGVLAAALWAGSGVATPAHACGYEDYVCEAIEYARERACVKFRICL